LLLFNSEKAVFDGKKAIRGGIPVVFRKYMYTGQLSVLSTFLSIALKKN